MQKIAILGHGKEGRAVEEYFQKHGASVTIFDDFAPADLADFQLADFDAVFRSPSVPLSAIPGVKKTANGDYELPSNLTSGTKYFFAHCPCPIIGVTGTKGKGTTCSMLTAILREAGKTVHLLGNIGHPAIAELDQIQATDFVVYEMSSFQLWDLRESPSIAVVLRIEPDHLDIHGDFTDYLTAKSHITAYQHPGDTVIYFEGNEHSRSLAAQSPATTKLPYPQSEATELRQILDQLQIPGQHNRENAQAALLAATAILGAKAAHPAAASAFAKFQSLPHHIEFVRELRHVKYYDDSFSASYPSLDVAISALSDTPTVLIAGGKNRHLDLTATKNRIFSAPSVKKVLLIGETAPLLAEGQDPARYALCASLSEAVEKARQYAEPLATQHGTATVLLSPGAASFDMFKNFADRGEQFQKIVKGL